MLKCYTPKQLKIKAVFIDCNKLHEIESKLSKYGKIKALDNGLLVYTLEGKMFAKCGEAYIVVGTIGELYLVRKDVFENKYIPCSDKSKIQ